MIQDYFQLQRQPFPSIPTPELYFPASSIEAARTSLVRLIDRNEGPGLVIGPTGTGKSLLCQLVAESFRHRCRVVALPSGRLPTRRALLQVILFELGLPYREMDEGELRLSLIDHVANRDDCPHGILLLVDESESLHLNLLDELRSLTNLNCDGQSCVRLVLFGAPRLEEKFTHPRLESLNQRLAGRFYLDPFSIEETTQFIEQAFADSGGHPRKVFSAEALRRIHQATGGIPRLVSQLADHALVLTAIDNQDRVDSDRVEGAWADLQQLPMPYGGKSPDGEYSMPTDIVEFGELESDAENDLDASPTAVQRESLAPHAESVDGPTQFMCPPFYMEPTESGNEESGDGVDSTSGITLVFHSSNNPFGDDFEEEELVIDHFVSPEAFAQRHRRQVQSVASIRLAEQMFQLRHQLVIRTHSEASICPEAAGRTNSGIATAAQVVAIEQPNSSRQNTLLYDDLSSVRQLSEKAPQIEMSDAHDDEGIGIIYLGDHTTTPESATATSANVTAFDTPAPLSETLSGPHSPRSYRNLFSQLRRRQG